MKIATVPRKKRKQFIIIVILLLGIPLVVFASLQVSQWITRAATEPEPKNILFTNVGTQEFTVSWVTEDATTGSIIPIVNDQDGTPIIDTRGSKRRKTHHVTMRALEPNTNYNFSILSNDQRYGDGASDIFSFKTPPVSPMAPTANPVSGSVNGVNNEDGTVFVSTKSRDVHPVSSTVSKGNTWNVDLSSLRKISDGSYIVVRETDELVVLIVAGIDRGAYLEGKYNELFDSNGVLKDVFTLNVEQMDNPHSKLSTPAISQPPVDTPTTPIPEDDDDRDFDIPDFDRETDIRRDRIFRIISQVEWTDMTTVEGLAAMGGMREESVEIINISDTGFTVIWLSRQKEQGYIKFGTSRESITNEASDERDGITTRRDYYVHYVPVTRLQPDMDYYFEIYSGDNVFDNNGQKYSVRTFPRLTTPPPFESVAGNLEGMPSHGEAVVTAHIQDMDGLGSLGESKSIGSLVDQRGKWILSISDSRTEDGLSYFEFTSEDLVKFDIYTTTPVETHTEQAQGIGSRDIDISLSGVLGVDSGQIGLLSNYGILGYSTGAHLPPDDEDPIDYEYEYVPDIQPTTKIPKTGIFDNMTYILILSSILVVTPVSVYIISVTKKRRKDRMIKSL